MPICWHCKHESSTEHHERVVYNNTPLHGPWSGWRMAGRFLISPDRDKITPERLLGQLLRERTDQLRRCEARRPTQSPTD